MKLSLLACMLWTAALSAVEILPGGFVTPSLSKDNLKQTNSKDYFQIRNDREVFVSPDTDGTLSVYIKNSRVGRYGTETNYTLLDMDGVALTEGRLPLNAAKVVKLTGLKQGIYRCALDSSQNSAFVRSDVGYCCAEASEASPLNLIYHCPKLYFSLLSGHLKMTVRGEGEMEPVALTIWDANGNVLLSENSVGKGKIMVDLPIPKDQEGGVWSMKLDRVPGKGFEDMTIAITEGAEPIVALKPDGLVFPIVRMEQHSLPDGKVFSGIAMSPLVKNVPNLLAEYTFTPEDGCTFPAQRGTWRSGAPSLSVGFPCDKAQQLMGTLAVTVKRVGDNKAQKKQAWTSSAFSWKIAICEGKLFREIAFVEHGKEAPVTAADNARGYQVFQRAEPGFVRPTTTPRANEICSQIKAETSPGLISAEFFAIRPLKAFDNATVTISDLVSDSGDVIPASAIDILSARIWAQRIDWNSSTYILAPELLDKKNTLALKANYPQQYCIRLKVPAATQPGVYKGSILLNGAKCLGYQLTVDDFALPEYNEITFGLYADGERWHTNPYSDDEVRAEMKMYRDYGMNALMVYPFTGSKIVYDGAAKVWSVNFDVFRRHQKIYKEVGFPGIQVISFQAMRGWLQTALNRIGRRTTKEEYMAGFKACLDEIRRIGKEDGWGPYCLHTVDEPHTVEGASEARDTLKFIRENGFETFCTCFHGEMLKKYIAEWLTYRCYSAVAYGPFGTRQVTDDIRKETLSKGANFWWYGSGCYTNGGLMQDCNVYSNRHMLGLFQWKTKATGAWTWTFLRAKGDIYNDLDHNNSVEAKEACICYPMPKGNGLIDTLQWEGCREGIYDYRYLRLWEDMVAKAAQNPDKANLAAQSRKKVLAATEKISWTCLAYGVTNQQMRDVRKLLIGEIKKLK